MINDVIQPYLTEYIPRDTKGKTIMNKPLVIYHANCDDGFGAAFAAWLKFGDEGAEYVPMNHGDIELNTPIMEHEYLFRNRDVYIVDFSFILPVMQSIQRMSTRLIVLDHHKTAKEALESMTPREQDHIEFDMNRSGAMMTWEYFFADFGKDLETPEPPSFFKYIQDNDLWKHKLPGCKAFIRRLRSYPQEFNVWRNLSKLENGLLDDFISEGAAIEEFFQQQCQYAIGMGKRSIEIDGIKGLGVNCTKMFSSDVGNILAKESGTFGATWMENDKGEVEFSLRSIGEYDVSIIAKKFGGGGHRNAAGFSLKPDSKNGEATLWSTPRHIYNPDVVKIDDPIPDRALDGGWHD